MRFRTLVAASLFLAAVARQGVRADDLLPDPIHSPDRQFEIPFQLAAGESEVRLYVSDDLGATWKMHAAAKPPLESFQFQAADEREYWFALRSLDTAGRESSTGPMRPEMRVIVDASKPRLHLVAEPTASNSVLLKWRADDANLLPDTLKLTWRGPSVDAQPRGVSALRTKRRLDAGGASGEVEWRPEVPLDGVTFTAEVADAAGNVEATEARAMQAFARAETPAGEINSLPQLQVAAAPPSPNRDPSQPLMVNSTAFELDYDVDPAVASDVTKVEVWGTRDDGRTWLLLGLDDDRRSPCSVSVEKAGQYGFTIAVHAPAKGQVASPRNGDAPEVRVAVDLSKPRVRLTTAEPPADGRACALQINWEAIDDNLGPQAVTLSYAGSRQGPWRPLAVGVPNDGGRICDFDPSGPDFAYLKIDVRDEAGNTATHATTVAIPIEKRPVRMTFAGASRPEAAGKGPKWFHVLQ